MRVWVCRSDCYNRIAFLPRVIADVSWRFGRMPSINSGHSQRFHGATRATHLGHTDTQTHTKPPFLKAEELSLLFRIARLEGPEALCATFSLRLSQCHSLSDRSRNLRRQTDCEIMPISTTQVYPESRNQGTKAIRIRINESKLVPGFG